VTRAELSDVSRTSRHAVVGVRRFAAVEFDGPGRQVRRVVSMFTDARAAELFAIEAGWSDYAVASASIVASLRE
jgi:hypothetical protein